MIRVKTFDATGVAPGGRLFAGDLNAIQDAAAGLADFTQTIDTSVLRVGDSAIQLLKFGTLDARVTAALRADGILRGLGGLYAGAFTTAQRNAIGAGFRPHGLVILNTDTVRHEWNAGSDATPNWQPLGGVDTGTALPSSGNYNGRPFDYVRGDKIWNMVYRADLDATYPWHWKGGGSVEAASGAALPNAGHYYIELSAVGVHTAAGGVVGAQLIIGGITLQARGGAGGGGTQSAAASIYDADYTSAAVAAGAVMTVTALDSGIPADTEIRYRPHKIAT